MKDKPCDKYPMGEVSDKLISKGKFKQSIEKWKNKQKDPEYSA